MIGMRMVEWEAKKTYEMTKTSMHLVWPRAKQKQLVLIENEKMLIS